jgi:hypothetical protein
MGLNERGLRDALTVIKPQEVRVKCSTAQFNYVDIAQNCSVEISKFQPKKSNKVQYIVCCFASDSVCSQPC